jgi:hypothetical protein
MWSGDERPSGAAGAATHIENMRVSTKAGDILEVFCKTFANPLRREGLPCHECLSFRDNPPTVGIKLHISSG